MVETGGCFLMAGSTKTGQNARLQLRGPNDIGAVDEEAATCRFGVDGVALRCHIKLLRKNS